MIHKGLGPMKQTVNGVCLVYPTMRKPLPQVRCRVAGPEKGGQEEKQGEEKQGEEKEEEESLA